MSAADSVAEAVSSTGEQAETIDELLDSGTPNTDNVQESMFVQTSESDCSIVYDEQNKTAKIFSGEVELRKGRIVVNTGFALREGQRAIVVPCEDNAKNGLLIEGGARCVNSDVIPTCSHCGSDIIVVINVGDDVMITEQGSFGSRTRFARIPSGTLIAELVVM